MNKIVSEEEWIEARNVLLKKEKEPTILRDQLSQQQRDLPWVAVNKEYIFEGRNGKQTFFDGKSQLNQHTVTRIFHGIYIVTKEKD
jgi:predicted dithiol-disulfide oxidoreductase (DUF899 family)